MSTDVDDPGRTSGTSLPEVRVRGVLSSAMVGAIRSALAALPGEPAVRIDLSGVTGTLPDGLESLAAGVRAIEAAGVAVVLLHAPPTLQDALARRAGGSARRLHRVMTTAGDGGRPRSGPWSPTNTPA